MAATDGILHIAHFDEKLRSKRAMKAFAICLGLATVSVFVHPGSFVLVPTFLIAAPISALWISRQTAFVSGGEGVCPVCQAKLPFASGSLKWPYNDHCSACHSDLKVNEV